MIIDTNGQNNFKTITDNFIINEENNNYVENKNENLNEKSDHDILQIKPLEKKLSAFILKSPISDNLGNLSDKKYLDDLNYIVRTKFKNNISDDISNLKNISKNNLQSQEVVFINF